MSTILRFILLASCLVFACKAPQSQAVTDYIFSKSIVAENAAVVAAHPLATAAGIEVLQKGGNAVDAAIAVQLALAVCYPRAGNIGGGGFMLYRDPSGDVTTLDYREKAPAMANRDMYLGKGPDSTVIPNLSLRKQLSVGVPGTPAGLYEAFLKHSKLKNWAALVEPAIILAEKGFRLTVSEAGRLNTRQIEFDTCNTVRSVFQSKTPWEPGNLMIQKDLAETLRRIQAQGAKGFYEGKTADLLVAEMKRGNGIISHKDLKDYKPVWRKSMSGSYRGYTIYTMPPPSSGGVVLLQCLKMIEPYPIADWGQHSVETTHLMIEAEKRAFADRAQNIGDPDFWHVPMQILLDSVHIAGLMYNFDPNKATPWTQLPTPDYNEKENTTHLSIVDAFGGAVSVTTTLNDNYGSFVVVGGAGFLLNDEMDDFTSKLGVKNMYGSVTGPNNAIIPGKRMLSSMTPTIVTRDNDLILVTGTPGGTTIPTSVFQAIINVIDFKQSAIEAISKPRFHHQHTPDSVSIEPLCLSKQTRLALISKGHAFKPRGSIGLVEAILRRSDGWLEAAADPRSDDDARGY
jgi:gamma-glutamyltranspeptidase / glutathione hydrolase